MTLSDLANYSMTQSARGLSATAELLVSSRYVILNITEDDTDRIAVCADRVSDLDL